MAGFPSIVTEGESLAIDCDAPPGTVGWTAELVHGELAIPLALESAELFLGLRRIGLEPLDELADLADSFNRMSRDLKGHIVQLTETTAAKERIEADLRIAHGLRIASTICMPAHSWLSSDGYRKSPPKSTRTSLPCDCSSRAMPPARVPMASSFCAC